MNPEHTAWRSNAAPWVMPSPACTDTALAGSRDAALANTRALGDPFIGGVDLAGELRIGEDMLGQVAPDAQNDRPRHAHEAAPAVRGAPCRCAPSMPLIFARSSYLAMS